MTLVNYIYETLKLKTKIAFEYKSNFYSFLILQPFWILMQVMFIYFLISYNVIKDWTLTEYLIFFIFVNYFITAIEAMFVIWRNSLKNIIKHGEMNDYLFRPINPIIVYLFDFGSVGMLRFFF